MPTDAASAKLCVHRGADLSVPRWPSPSANRPSGIEHGSGHTPRSSYLGETAISTPAAARPNSSGLGPAHLARDCSCPLWVKSRHVQCKRSCPLCANSGHDNYMAATFALMPPFAACVTPNPHSAPSTTLSSLSGPGPASTTTTSMTR